MIHYESERLILRSYQMKDIQDSFAYMSLEETALHEDFLPFTLSDCERAVKEQLSDDTFWELNIKRMAAPSGICACARAIMAPMKPPMTSTHPTQKRGTRRKRVPY